jgi:rhamnosyl/mannosyltransferase
MRTYKGVEWLLEAVGTGDDIELTLIGDGPHLADYKRLAAELGNRNIRFLGRVTDDELHNEYDCNDVVVLPSVTRAEAFGLVVLEGMAAGCVPVVTNLPGVRDLVAHAGVVVPPRDVAALKTALVGLGRDSVQLEELARASRRRAEGLDWEVCIDRYEELMLEVAHGRRGIARPRRARAQRGAVGSVAVDTAVASAAR